ncbi:MAG: hypothetical protein H6706_02510 [Myxococcales bacterium]|nr:hypothetical protein [Myxococcales bacterium]
MRRPPHRVRGRLIAAIAALLPAAGLAHGPAPAALGAVGPDADPALVVRTNIGLGVRRAGGAFGYLCPGAWGEEERVAPAVTLADGTLVVVAGGAAHRSPPDGCGFEATPLPGAGTVAALVADVDVAWAATREGEDTSIWRIPAAGAPARAFVLPGAEVTDLAVADGLLAAVARPAPAVVRLGPDGPASTPVAVGPASYLGLRAGGRFLHATLPDGPRLFERTPTGEVEVLRAFTSLRGPVPDGDGWLALADSVVQRRPAGAEAFEAGEETRWTCLERRGDATYVCADRRLYTWAGGELAEVFRLEDLVGVDCPDQPLCEGQWLHFGGEAGLVRGLGADAGGDAGASPEPAAASGCQGSPGPATPVGLLLLLLLRVGGSAGRGSARRR